MIDHANRRFMLLRPAPLFVEELLVFGEMFFNGAVGMPLHAAVERGIHRQPVPVEIEPVFLRLLRHLLPDVFDKMRGDPRHAGLIRRTDMELLRGPFFCLHGCE